MKKTGIGIFISICIFYIGTFATQFLIKPYFFPTWQGDKDSSCEEMSNPLCSYSVDLHEIPTVTISELSQNPQKYNDKIIRVQGRYYSELNDYFDSRLYSIENKESIQQVLDVRNIWNNKINETLCHFIDFNSPETNEADVTLIVEFYDAKDDVPNLKRNYNNPFQFTILRVEEMNPVLNNENPKPLKPRIHQAGHECNRRESQIDF